MKASPPFCRIVAVITAATILLLPGIGGAQVSIEMENTPSAEASALAQLIARQLDDSRPRTAAVNVKITVGVNALRQTLAQGERQAIIAVVSSADFDAVLAGQPRPSSLTAVFTNPDPNDQVTLARAILGRSALGVFDAAETRTLVAQISDRDVRAIPVRPGQSTDSLLRAVDPLSAVIVLPDAVLNRSNINHVVRSLYQRRKVLIGYSDTLTRVGSLASVYVAPSALVTGVVDSLDRYAATGVMPDPLFVRQVEVSLNERLARSLNIVMPERAELARVVRASQVKRAAR